MNEEKYQKLRDYALKLLSFRPRSSKEIKGKLMQFSIKKGFGTKLVEQVIADLISQNLINDKEFINWWIEQRQTFKPKGMRAIFMELAQKGIDREAIAEVLAKRGEDKGSEFGLAEKLVNKKLVHFQHLAKENFKKKIAGMLQRRGFSWETIYKVIDSLKEK